MKFLILIAGVLTPSFAIADARCIALENSVLINKCQTCMEVTVHELRPAAERTTGLFSGASRTVRLEAGERETLQGNGSWIISDLKVCH